ncbi:hypothetical protein [Burkholderia gladioli]|uniref:hypothetical protein n=1 Tax=Burkholderia gladioli TaxID=28095 RepID=UPI0010FEDA1F|nr:hypothetical protein [Burkholderia gladioli]
MSKQSEAKEAQGWRKKAAVCAHCLHFKFDRVETPSQWGCAVYVQEKNLRCSLGGFKTGKSNTCDYFTAKDSEVQS